MKLKQLEWKRKENRVERKKKGLPVMKIGTNKRFLLCMWVVLIGSVAFGVYKNFTAIDTHTVHEKKVIKEKIVDTNSIENFVSNFAKDYYTWENDKESIEKRVNRVNEYFTEELQALNANVVRMDIPNSSIVKEVRIWSVKKAAKKEFEVLFSVEQIIKEEKKEAVYESYYTMTVHQDTEGKMLIVKNPTISRKIGKSDYEPEEKENDSSIDSKVTSEVTEFLNTFFKLYPSANEKELAYYVQNQALKPVENENYVFSDVASMTFQQSGKKLLVSVTVNYLDKQTKTVQISQFELTLEKDENWMIVERR